MHRAYTDNAGSECQRHAIAYQGIAEETHAAAVKSRGRIARKPLQIASVSAMAPHKGVETVVQALAKLRRTRNLSPSLLLIGIWPVPAYEQRIRRLVIATGLQNVVTFLGHVSQEDLYRYYAESSVFCLMSQCESFGIPAVEAQAFGTPVVSSNCCAIPEVCGSGGIFPAPGDVAGTAGALAELLTRRDTWNRLSTAAVQNAAKYHWDICSQPLISTLQTLRRESI
ncbi:MAG: glycosyltransferase [Verrucomicrobiota bacterium]